LSGGQVNRVIVVGSFNLDHVWRCATLPQAGATLAGDYASGPGGKGFNQAVGAVRAGATTGFLCALGSDAGGQLARALAAGEGIDLRDLRSDRPTGTAGIFVDAEGRNAIAIGAGANASLSTAFIDSQRELLASADVVLAQLESPADAIRRTLRIAREHGATTILNPAPADADISGALLAMVDVLTPNETEFAALLARHLHARVDAATVSGMADDTLHGLCRRLLPHGTVLVTLGATGLFVSHADAALRGDPRPSCRIAAEAVHAVDTTGAGDACNGALAAALAMRPQAPFAMHARFASRFAALSTEQAGAAVAMPRMQDVIARFGDI
jgi:ribokinase